MTAPLRIQRKRTKGWRMPANTVSVTRPGRWGNPWVIDQGAGGNPWRVQRKGCGVMYACATEREAIDAAVEGLRQICSHPANKAYVNRAKAELSGKNLACFCRLCPKHEAAGGKPLNEHCPACEPCHVDPLGQIANSYPVIDSSAPIPASAVVETNAESNP